MPPFVLLIALTEGWEGVQDGRGSRMGGSPGWENKSGGNLVSMGERQGGRDQKKRWNHGDCNSQVSRRVALRANKSDVLGGEWRRTMFEETNDGRRN